MQGSRRSDWGIWIGDSSHAFETASRIPPCPGRRESSQAPRVDDPAHFDIAALAGLCAIAGDPPRELLAKVIATFLRSSAEVSRKIDAAAAAGDLRALEDAAHTLKSSSGQVGALRLSRLARELEVAAEQRATDDCETLRQALSRELALLDDSLRAEFPEVGDV